MCGYILKGNNDKIINKLNYVLGKKSLNQLQVDKTINEHSLIYKITNDGDELIKYIFGLSVGEDIPTLPRISKS